MMIFKEGAQSVVVVVNGAFISINFHLRFFSSGNLIVFNLFSGDFGEIRHTDGDK